MVLNCRTAAFSFMNLALLNDISPLEPSMKIAEAQLLCDECTLTHFPVVANNRYLGSVARYDIKSSDSEKLVGDLKYEFESFCASEETNSLGFLEVISKYQTNIMPVLSQEEKEYMGYVELQDILDVFSDMPFLSEHGNIIVVAKGISDQSFSEICQIVESNNVKVLASYISDMENDMVQTTLKIGDGDFNTVIQTFRRYGYTIISDHYDDVFLNSLKERSRYFNKYLNM